MSTKSKSSFVPTLVVMVALAAIVGIVVKVPMRTRTDPNAAREVVLSAIWNPSPRPEGVAWRITLDGAPREDAVSTVAPITRSYTVAKGTRVEIYVRLQGEHRAELGCSIMVNGAQMINEHKRNAGPVDSLACWLVV